MELFSKINNSLRHRTKAREETAEAVIALAGNPNVGKSTVFNRLTGLHQHTGNWAGKTVATAEGFFRRGGRRFRLVDIPGMYSYSPRSAEEVAAVEFLRSGRADAVIVVCDAGCLARGIGFVLETAELTGNVIVCVNLTDEAERRGIHVDTRRLSKLLGMPVVRTSAAHGKGIDELAECGARVCAGLKNGSGHNGLTVRYPAPIEEMLKMIESGLTRQSCRSAPVSNLRYMALHLLLSGDGSPDRPSVYPDIDPRDREEIEQLARNCRGALAEKGLDGDKIAASVASRRILTADAICEQCIAKDGGSARSKTDKTLDRIFTGRGSGRLCMLLLLCVVFWLTITGANYPSAWLSRLFGGFEEPLRGWLAACGIPAFFKNMLVDGVYRVLTRIIAVMLPPMAIFFPLFTMLEDAGYLPRAAFNLDNSLRRCGACGKQALTSCMGFGCNAVGVTGCRIIDSPRERIMATVTNSFIPCNGRFPILTALISMFFLGSVAAPWDSVLGAVILTALICMGLGASFGVSKLLSLTLLKGTPSSFVLELPPYRKPKFGSVIFRSALDRTLFVLGRAAAVAAPAGALIWLTANVHIGGDTVLSVICRFLDPVGHFLGMDGVILTAFILGFPANETVIPLMIMAYMAQDSMTVMTGMNDPVAIQSLLSANGWNIGTAICVMLFTLMHWPCATTCVTVYRETKSLKWTVLSVLIPTLTGCVVCAAVALAVRLLF